MFERLIDSIRNSPFKMAYAVAVLAVILNAVILALWFQRRRAANDLAAQIMVIEENLALLKQIEGKEIKDLRAQLAAAEDRLSSLERSLASAETPFDLPAEVFDIAEQSGLVILSMEQETVATEETSEGSFTAERFSFQAEGEFPAFVEFVENLEAAAPKSVSLDSMLVTQEERTCSFEVIVVSGPKVLMPTSFDSKPKEVILSALQLLTEQVTSKPLRRVLEVESF